MARDGKQFNWKMATLFGGWLALGLAALLLVFAALLLVCALTGSAQAQAGPSGCAFGTGETMNLVLRADSMGAVPTDTALRAYDAGGECVGQATYEGANFALTVWGSTFGSPGAESFDPLRLLSADGGAELIGPWYDVFTGEQRALEYLDGRLYTAGAQSLVIVTGGDVPLPPPEPFALYPNPTAGILRFSRPAAGVLYDVRGRRLEVWQERSDLNLSRYQSAAYFVRVEGRSYRVLLHRPGSR